ncbi:alcohol dehydrogenase catalytic domain-containing protein [Chitinophaga niabensis]|uniref:zinc-dependent alcohol dehydrogenase n=1 Tax=Chitinophaga niabensis TaxID=536979 RepID=UPI0031BB5A1C
MKQIMQALQMRGLNTLVKTEVPIPVPGAGDVLIQTLAATICTSDLHDLKSNPFGITYPRILGHEAAGIVVATGREVRGLALGTRVAVHPVVPCGKCEECKRGLAHICSDMGHLGYDRDGSFAEYFTQRADRVIPLPENISNATGALLEPVAVCLQAVARAGDVKGRTVLVAGDGPFGNIIARLAKRAGAARVIVTGKIPFRLQSIPDVEIPDADPVRCADVAILAVSSQDALSTCIKALRPRGRLVVFSALKEPAPLDLFALHLSELEIVGACNDEDRMEEALECLQDKVLNLAEIITHQVHFENWEEAFSLVRYQQGKALKVAITFS